MLFSILKFLMQITGKVFFRSVAVRNKEVIPKKGPLMILANHPSSFMDPIVIATMLNRKVYFLAKGELFNNAFSRWILPKMNIIPVYRKQDNPSDMGKNEETFIKCYEHLENGGAILMFPEGTSITERKLRPLKTGAARIVLEAESKNDFSLNTQVITIGLNYANPHKFNRDLFINVDEPIHVSEYKNDYTEDKFKGVEALTECIRLQLEKSIIAINDEQTDNLTNDVETLYKYKLSQDIGITSDDKEAEFDMIKNIAASVSYFKETDPSRVEIMRTRIYEYLNNLKQLGLNDTQINSSHQNKSIVLNSIKSLIITVLGFPFYVYGLINNYLPFEIPGWIADKTINSIEFRGAVGMVLGLFTFLIFYTFQIILVWKFSQSFWITFVYGISLPLTAFFTYWYYHTVAKIHAKWMLMIVFYKKSSIVSSLIRERELIISEIDEAKKEYLNLTIST